MKLGRAQEGAEAEEVKPFTAEQLARFLEAARVYKTWLYPLFAMMALAGLRLGEALALKWASVDREQREIRVARTLAPSAKDLDQSDRLGTPKSGKARTVDMNVTLVDVLREHEQAAKAAALQRGAGGVLPAFVFTTQRRGVWLTIGAFARRSRWFCGARGSRRTIHRTVCATPSGRCSSRRACP
jgi:integrase